MTLLLHVADLGVPPVAGRLALHSNLNVCGTTYDCFSCTGRRFRPSLLQFFSFMKAASMLSFLLGIQDLSWEKEELNFVRCQYGHRSNKILLGASGMPTFRGI